MVKTRKIPLRKSVVSNEVIDKRDLLRIVKIKKVKFLSIQLGKQMVVVLISSSITRKHFKPRRRKSSIAALAWKWMKLSTTN